MMRSSLFTRSAMGIALALGVAGGIATPAAAKDDKAAKAGGGYSKEFSVAAQPLQTALKNAEPIKARFDAAAAADKPAIKTELDTALNGAPALLATAQAAAKTPQDRFAVGQFGLTLGGLVDDLRMRQSGIQSMLDSGLVPPAKINDFYFYLGNFAFINKDFAAAIPALTKAVEANYSDDAAAQQLAESYAQSGKPLDGLNALKRAIEVRKAAGGAVPSVWYSRANSIAYKNKLTQQGIEWSIAMVADQPTPLNWLGAAELVRTYGNFTSQESLDLGRLMLRAGGLENEKKYAAREYVEYIQAADPRRLPAEVIKLGERGIAAGMLNASDPFMSDAMAQARGRIAADKASLGALERDARAPSATAATAMAAGDANMSYDNAAKAAEFYTIALGKAGVDTPRALTRLGIAQADLGQYAEATATFNRIDGPRKPLAQMWLAYVANKAKAPK